MKIKEDGKIITVKSVKIRCGHCGIEWEYHGYDKHPDVVTYFATCPNCHYKRNIEKERIR